MLPLCLLLALQQPMPDPVQDYWAALLRSGKPEDRVEATRRLKSMGKAALGAVEPLLKDPDPEVWDLAREIVADMRSHDPDPARLKLEETLLRAKTVRLRFEVRDGTGDDKVLYGEVLVKEGGRLRCWMLDTTGGGPVRLRLISDGQKFFLQDTRSSRTIETPAGLGGEVLIGLVRAGLFPTLTGLSLGKMDSSRHLNVRNEVRSEPANGEVLLRFDLHLDEQKGGFHHQVRCQPEKGILGSRTILRQGSMLREDYLEMALDADIPDEAFAIPGK